jgi:hypothetical protein
MCGGFSATANLEIGIEDKEPAITSGETKYRGSSLRSE